MNTASGEFGVVIPAFREGARIAAVVKSVAQHAPAVVVIDDGSDDDTAANAEAAGAVVLRHECNKGKGCALETGIEYCGREAFDFIVTMDGDGQHAPEDIDALVGVYRETGAPVVVGSRMENSGGMPFVRRMTNRFMSWLLSREMGQVVPDTQSGFRLYACEVFPHLSVKSARFAAESEVLLDLSDKGFAIASAPIRTIYGDERSKINPFVDTFRFFEMLKRHRSARKGRRRAGA